MAYTATDYNISGCENFTLLDKLLHLLNTRIPHTSKAQTNGEDHYRFQIRQNGCVCFRDEICGIFGSLLIDSNFQNGTKIFFLIKELLVD